MSDNTPTASDFSSRDALVLERAVSDQDFDSIITIIDDVSQREYHVVKKAKQRNLHGKIAEAEKSNDRSRVRSAKKKVDNHASAVASRAKQTAKNKAYEQVIRNLMHREELSAQIIQKKNQVIQRRNEEIASIVADNRSLKQYITLTEERQSLGLRLPTHQTVSSSALSSSQDQAVFLPGHTFPGFDLAADSLEHSSLKSEPFEVPVGYNPPQPNDNENSQPFIDRMAIETPFSYEEHVNLFTEECEYDAHKFDTFSWEDGTREGMDEGSLTGLRAQFEAERDENKCNTPAA